MTDLFSSHPHICLRHASSSAYLQSISLSITVGVAPQKIEESETDWLLSFLNNKWIFLQVFEGQFHTSCHLLCTNPKASRRMAKRRSSESWFPSQSMKYEVVTSLSGLCWVGRVYVQRWWLPNENTCWLHHVVFKTVYLHQANWKQRRAEVPPKTTAYHRQQNPNIWQSATRKLSEKAAFYDIWLYDIIFCVMLKIQTILLARSETTDFTKITRVLGASAEYLQSEWEI